MSNEQLQLRDFRRAVEQYEWWKDKLQSCARSSWDGQISGFKEFLKTTAVVGEQVLGLANLTTDDIFGALADKTTGRLTKYSPPSDETKRLSYIARMLLDFKAGVLFRFGMELTRNGNANFCFEHVRTEILNELLESVSMKLRHKLEDLEEQYHQDAAAVIPLAKTVIFQNVFKESTIAVSTGSGNIIVNMNAASELGVQTILRQLTELRGVLNKVADEQERKVVADEADDLALHRKLEEIIALVRENKPGPAVGKWKEFLESANVSTFTDAAGKIVDGVTFGLWLFNMSMGLPPGKGLG
ncbi:MAG TPA: hypothetical protein VGP72_00365 [Planctomycetota bacterium]|jgi:hypothetical protein